MWWAPNENLRVVNMLSCSLRFDWVFWVFALCPVQFHYKISSGPWVSHANNSQIYISALGSHLWHVGTSYSTCFPNLLILLSCFFQLMASCTYPDAPIRNFGSTLVIPCIWSVHNLSLCFPHLPSLGCHCLSFELL